MLYIFRPNPQNIYFVVTSNMATPILSKPQQRKSLSAKKVPIKGLKNVLGQPYDIYWPTLRNDHDAALENLLKRLLLVLKPTKTKIPWPQLRKMNKEERLAAKKAQSSCNDNCNKSSIIFGINAVTRSLEKNDICCILLNAKIDPSLLIKHIVSMAKDKSVPILLVPFLKKLTLETIGFSSAAIALKKHVQVSPENYFHSLFVKISELSLELIGSKAPNSSFKEYLENDDTKEDIQKNIQAPKKYIKPNSKISTNVYLYRTSRQERIFKPPTLSKDEQEIEMSSSNFIPLGNDKDFIDNNKPVRYFSKVSSEYEKANISNNKVSRKQSKKIKSALKSTLKESGKGTISYKPLKVKRLRGNEFRTKATKLAKVKKNTNV